MIIFEHNGSDVSQFDDRLAPDLTVDELIKRLVRISDLRDCDPTDISMRYVPGTDLEHPVNSNHERPV